MKSPVMSKSFAFLLPLLLALPLSAAASPSGTPPEAKCGRIVFRAFAAARAPVLRTSVKHIRETCDFNSASEFGPDNDERLARIRDKANEAIDRLGGEIFCDPELQAVLPLELDDFLNGSGNTEQFLNTFVTPICDGAA